jgi:hypothetical protein
MHLSQNYTQLTSSLNIQYPSMDYTSHVHRKLLKLAHIISMEDFQVEGNQPTSGTLTEYIMQRSKVNESRYFSAVVCGLKRHVQHVAYNIVCVFLLRLRLSLFISAEIW